MRWQSMTLAAILFIAGCGGGGGVGGGSSATTSTASNPQDIEQLNVPINFDYGMVQSVSLTVDVAPRGFASQEYVVLVYDTPTGSSESLIGKFITDQNGQLSTVIKLANARTNLKIIVSAFGFPNEQVVTVQNQVAIATFR